jgi:hypothetical protein
MQQGRDKAPFGSQKPEEAVAGPDLTQLVILGSVATKLKQKRNELF